VTDPQVKISCPGCAALLQPAQPLPRGDFRLACPACGRIFQVNATPEELPEALAEELPRAEPVRPPAPEGYGEAWICEPRLEFSRRLDRALSRIGFKPYVIHNGDDPGERELPRLALVSSLLLAQPGGLWQRLTSASPRPRLVLLGEIHNLRRYHRSPVQLYGADAYLEELEDDAQLETALREQIGLSAPPPEPVDNAAAVTLARQLFSDIILQHSDALSAMDGAAAREFCAGEMDYGRQLLDGRYPGCGGLLETIFNDYLRLKN
jgi:hypothetical protein